MAWTQSDVDVLKAAIKNGVKSVGYADRSVTYHSLAEMLQVLAAMEAEVASAGSTTSEGRSTLVSFSRG